MLTTYATEFAVILAIVFFTAYFIPAGIFHLIFFRNGIEGIEAGRIQKRKPNWKIVRFEIRHSLIATVLFAIYGTITWQFVKAGHSALYFNWSDYPWWMPIFGFVLAIILHDTYFYWTHRLAHWAPIYPWVHAGHHKSLAPTPWAILSFQPLETILQFGIFAIFIFFVPMHPITFLAYLFYDSLVNAGGHCGHEFAPPWQKTHPLMKYTNVVTHHDLHHSKFNYNYSQYFNIWDRLCGTFKDRE